MNLPPSFGSYVGVALGWLLGQASQWLRSRGERNAAIGRALADLLEVRHLLLGMNLTEDLLVSRSNATAETIMQLRQLVDSALPSISGLSERYNAAVSTIAETHPVLAFRLRSKEMVQQYFAAVRASAAGDAAAVQLMVQIERTIRPALVEALDESILDLARAHGLGTRLSVRQLLRQKTEFPKDAEPLMRVIDSAISRVAVTNRDDG